MISLSIRAIIEATGGKLISGDDSIRVRGVSIDSRSLRKNDIFFALKGTKKDGRSFVSAALTKCAAAVVEKDPRVNGSKPIILVKDSRAALGAMASLWRAKIKARVIAVSGSNGKTGTKDLLAHILKKSFRINAAKKSYNNFIGLPLTVIGTAGDADIMITEMETNVIGGIRRLCGIARPETGIITNISAGHLSDLKTIENVFREKSELAEYLSADGCLILNNDDPFSGQFKKKFKGKLITYSLKNQSHYRAKIIKTDLSGSEFILRGRRFKTSLPGKFNVLNISAAAATARLLGLPWDKIIERMRTFKAAPGRMNVKKIKGRVLINDAFNANPASAAALAELLKNESEEKALVFGDMLELGKNAAGMHEDTGENFAKAGVISIHYIGNFGKAFVRGAKKVNPSIKYSIYQDRKKLMAGVRKEDADIIAFKASRAMALDEIFDRAVKQLS